MIRYALRCASGHEFDAWFRNGDAFDEQAARGQVSCPVCASSEVAKAPMAPAIAKRGKGAPEPAETETPASGEAPAEENTSPAPVPESERAARATAVMRAFAAHIRANAEAVGACFPEEARRIHRGESEERAIWGQASAEDAEALRDEGIDVHAFPDPPEPDA